jgi:hypothetical protein
VKKLCAFGLASVALFTACGGDDDDGPTGPGNGNSGYTATITGVPGLTESSGDAFWTAGTDEESGQGAFVIGLQPEGETSAGILFIRPGAERAPNGSYDFVDNNATPTAQQFQMFSILPGFVCGAVSGTLNITESGSTHVKGTFQIDGQCASTTTEEPEFDVTINGTFDAVAAPGAGRQVVARERIGFAATR